MKKLKCGTILWIIVTISALYPHLLIYLYNLFTKYHCIRDIMVFATLYILLIKYYLFLCKYNKNINKYT